jgi:hypothetical protein
MKMGIGGFLAMLYLFGSTMRRGARAILRSPGGDEAAVLVTSAAFVLMYGVFAYVDIAWDAQNLVFLAVAIAHISTARTALPEPQTNRAEAPVLAAVH